MFVILGLEDRKLRASFLSQDVQRVGILLPDECLINVGSDEGYLWHRDRNCVSNHDTIHDEERHIILDHEIRILEKSLR